MDIAGVLTGSKAPRKYWNTLKSRNTQLSSICRKLKLPSLDGKRYLTDVIDDDGANTVFAVLPSKKSAISLKWMKTMGISIDEQSKQKIYSLVEDGVIDTIEVGAVETYRADKREDFVFENVKS